MADEGKIRILVVDDVVESQKNLARLLSFEPDMEVVGFASTGKEALEAAKNQQPHVILMDINMPDMDGLAATEMITKSILCSIVIISVQSDPDYMRRAMRAGAVDFLAKPPSAEELYATVRNAYQRRPEQVSAPQQTKEQKETVKVSGKVVVVYSPQGGAGVTTLAVNLATGLMGEGARSILIDANLQFGDVALHLDRPNERNVVDLSQAADVLDDELIQQVVITHESGLNALTAPKRPEEAELVEAANLARVVRYLAEQYEYVVVDTSLHLDDVTLNLFEVANVILMVGLPMLPAAKNLRLVMDLMNQIGVDPEKMVLAINRVPTDRKTSALNPDDMATLLKIPMMGAIPNVEKAMYDALNRGVPVIVNTRNSPGRELRDLCEKIRVRLEEGQAAMLEEMEDADKQSGFLGGLFSN